MKCIALLCVFMVGVAVCQDQVVNLNDLGKDEENTLSCGDNISSIDIVMWQLRTPSGLTTLDATTKTLNLTAEAKAGNYSCSFNNTMSSLTRVIKLVEPHFANVRTSVTYNNEDTNRKLTCETTGTYPYPKFSWFRKERDIENAAPIVVSFETNPNYRIVNNGTKSTLNFYNVTYSEAAIFICTVKNIAGNASVEVIVRVKDKYAAVWPFLGIVVEVVILIIIIFAYEKHSKKAELKKDVVAPPEDQKPLNRDEGMEIRNRNREVQT